jgi:hypothetical protein
MYASSGLENRLRKALAVLSDLPEAFGNRVSFRASIWPRNGVPDPDAAVCLLWHDLHCGLR